MKKQTNLFDKDNSPNKKAPLAHRLRPQTLEDFSGQKEVLAQLHRLGSHNPFHFIFWGPPGCGKTTLAHILAKKWKRELYKFNAVTSGIPDLKKLIHSIQEMKGFLSERAIIFIDEIHRFNKAQQDVLLPYLERGDFTLMGATTEYPQTSLNRAVISRVKLFELKKLDREDILHILKRANIREKLSFSDEYLELIGNYSNGDARIALSHLEYLYNSPQALKNRKELIKTLTQNARNFDKNSHHHYDSISAFIKSVRGSDPDAAIYWLAVMIDGGEDPIFIARRLMILASEDIGNANPQALTLASSTHYTVSKIGMPEGRIPLAQCTIYLASSPKSNLAYKAINKALAFVKERPSAEVPGHLKTHSPEKKNYQYPHDYPNHYIQQKYRFDHENFIDWDQQGLEERLEGYLKKLSQGK